jgi:uncharacterized membrane protein
MLKSFRLLYAVTAMTLASNGLATTFQVTDLGKIAKYDSSSANALNDAGDVVGQVSNVAGPNVPARFAKGKNSLLLRKAGQPDLAGRATAISPDGTAVGTFTSAEHPNGALFLAQGKAVTVSEPPGVDWLAITGINGAGTVVGFGSADGCPNCGFIYQDGQWTLVQDANFYGIRTDGRMVGSIRNQGEQAATFQDGQAQPLPDLGGGYSSGRGFNAAGDVVGEALPPEGGIYGHAILIRGTQVIDLHPHGHRNSTATAINDKGWIIGGMGYPAAPGFSQGGRLQDINGLLSADQQAQWEVMLVNSINNKGQIAGEALPKGDAYYHAVLLTPVPAQ